MREAPAATYATAAIPRDGSHLRVGLPTGWAAGSRGPRDDGTATDLDLPGTHEGMLGAASTDAIPGIIDPALGAEWSGLIPTVRPRPDPR